jgi:hypothetical protein
MPSDTTPAAPPLLDPLRAAQALSISPRTLWTLTAAGEIPAVRVGKRLVDGNVEAEAE